MIFDVLKGIWAQERVSDELFSMLIHQKGELFLMNGQLCPSGDKSWGTILNTSFAVPNNPEFFKNTRGTNM